MESHNKGVNWVTFNSNGNTLASGADDKQVKLWKMSESKMW